MHLLKISNIFVEIEKSNWRNQLIRPFYEEKCKIYLENRKITSKLIEKRKNSQFCLRIFY